MCTRFVYRGNDMITGFDFDIDLFCTLRVMIYLISVFGIYTSSETVCGSVFLTGTAKTSTHRFCLLHFRKSTE